jgi:hypothetical protein
MNQRAAALEEKYGKKIWTLTEAERKALIESGGRRNKERIVNRE